MTRSLSKCFLSAVLVAASILLTGVPCRSMTLISPTADQVVREGVKIVIPASALPSGFLYGGDSQRPFIGILVGEPGSEEFVEAVSASSVVQNGNNVIVYWDSKSPYRDKSDPKTDKYLKDGTYSLRVQIYEQTQQSSKVVDSASVRIVLKNKVDRTSPAPAVTLANALAFGQSNSYRIRTGLQLFDMVDLPILSSLGVGGDFRVLQTVEDVRANGQIMLRCRLDDSASTDIFGWHTLLYQGQKLLPQLYRLVDKYGNVFNPNMFKKQAQYTITDVLPALPNKLIKEGDSWSDSMSLKVEGITGVIKLTGSCMLDSFEWHQGKECAKLVSQMSGNGQISFNGNKIRSAGPIKARVTTYFAYKTGKAIARVIDLSFPVAIEQGAGDPGATPGVPEPTTPPGSVPSDLANETTGNPIAYASRNPSYGPTGSAQPAASTTPTIKGSAIMTVTMQLEQ